MPYNFNNSSLLNFSFKKEYINEEGVASLNNTKVLTLKGFIDNRALNSDSKGVKENFDQINQILANNSGQLEGIIINGVNFGTGKVISVKFPKENPIRFGEFEYDIEIYEKSDLSHFGGDKYGSFLPSITEVIKDFSEDISFDYQNGKYSYNHDLSIEFKESDINYSNRAKNIASGIFSDNILLGLCEKFSGYFNSLKNKKSNFKETYDDINLKYSFGKVIEVDENYTGDNYNKNYTYNISLDNLGKISVTEKGEIYSLSTGTIFDASGIMENEINSSYNRCANLFSSYKNNNLILIGQPDNLYSKPISLARIFEKDRNFCSYSAQYINDPRFNNNLFITTTSESSFSGPGDGTSSSTNLEILKIGQANEFTHQDYVNIKNIIAPYINLGARNFGLSYQMNHNLTGNLFQCSFTTTNNSGFRPNDPDFRYFDIQNNNTEPPDMYNEYKIPNKKRILIVDGGQMNLSQKTVTLNTIIKRPTGSSVSFALPIERIKSELVSYGLAGVGKEAYIEPVSLKYNSNFEVSATIKVSYLNFAGSNPVVVQPFRII